MNAASENQVPDSSRGHHGVRLALLCLLGEAEEAGSFLPPISRQQRHGEQMRQELRNREGWRCGPHREVVSKKQVRSGFLPTRMGGEPASSVDGTQGQCRCWPCCRPRHYKSRAGSAVGPTRPTLVYLPSMSPSAVRRHLWRHPPPDTDQVGTDAAAPPSRRLTPCRRRR